MKLDNEQKSIAEYMASERKRDEGMRQALRRKVATTPKLPTNFSYKTMQRIKVEKTVKECRNRWVETLLIILVSISEILTLILTCGSYYKETIKGGLLQIMDIIPKPTDFNLSIIVFIGFAFLFFMILNTFLRHHFDKKR